MKFRNLLAATAALSLAASPALAAPSASVDRVSAPVAQEESDLEGGSGIIIALLAAAAVIAGIVIAAGGNDDDPISA
ncbi:hypothetical protein [Allopontixanthobacter sediminis]|uniref:Ferrochelatase n=1 Tax=Allopontixanthobacter sediminis TaxID=1689985 RepID=A0A845B6R8_9SPHN|nr:hypothetical protein [Allopontixanthobacter sediminis]MXP45162.1 hypothetical protein [Allopontixanthobacter sediminis]